MKVFSDTCLLVLLSIVVMVIESYGQPSDELQIERKCNRGFLTKWKRLLASRKREMDDFFINFDEIAIEKISKITARCNSNFQWIVIGSGVAHMNQKELNNFFHEKHTHWNALFVEASTPLVDYMNESLSVYETGAGTGTGTGTGAEAGASTSTSMSTDGAVSRRVKIMHAAIMDTCEANEISFATYKNTKGKGKGKSLAGGFAVSTRTAVSTTFSDREMTYAKVTHVHI